MTTKVGNRRGAPWKTIFACAVAAWALASAPAFAEDKIIVGLITKTNANPFFAKMKEGAAAKAKELGVDFRSFAGKYDGDNDGPGGRDRAAHERRRQGDPDHAKRHQGDRADDRAGAQGRNSGDRARHAARSPDRGRRDLRDRQ